MLFFPYTIYCESTDLMIIPDILPTTVGLGRMSKIVSDMIYFTPFIKEVIVGLLLSDASIQRRKPTWNAPPGPPPRPVCVGGHCRGGGWDLRRV
jgi:hypothetical protein